MTATVSPSTRSTTAGNGRLGPLLERISRQSVEKHHDAYLDIAWDDPQYAISLGDPRIKLFEFDPLASTSWYQDQSPELQSIIGLHRIAAAMKIGMQFENFLQRGLLSYAMRMENGDPEFRYCQHEVIEESQHSLMFQELVNRTGLPINGMPKKVQRLATIAVPVINRVSPELFFMLVLGGEDPVDYLQRRQLREGTTHPLIERIMQIHITEEARHIAYARTFLKERVPLMSRTRRHMLSISVPIILGIMAPLMVDPTPDLQIHGVPRSVLGAARHSRAGAILRRESVSKQRRLCRELGLMTRTSKRVWAKVGLYADDAPSRPDTASSAN